MSKKSLGFKFSIEGDETVLRGLQAKLSGESELTDQLCAVVLQTLKDAGFGEDFGISVQCGQIKSRYGQGGGLNAMEWIERKEKETA